MKYSITTVSLPSLDMAGQCQFIKSLGYDGVELRARRVSDEVRAAAVPSNWGYHVNDITPENLASKADEIKGILADYELELAGLVTNMTCLDLEQFKNALEGAVAVGSPFIRLGASAGFTGKPGEDYKAIYGETVAGFSRCVELARGTGVKLIIEMHGNTIHPSASLAYRIASNFSPNQVGIIYDPQNMVRDGFETVAIAIPFLGDYLAHCHFGGHRPIPGEPDEKGTVQWKWEGCKMSEGLFHFPTAMKWLKSIGYKGFISVEDFRNVDNHEKFSDAITYLKGLEG